MLAIYLLNPSKIVDRVGKVMTPILLICLLIVLVATIINPLDKPMAPIGSYVDNAFFKGFQEGYLTMDTLASFVFGIIVINAIKAKGITAKAGIAKATIKAGLIAAGCFRNYLSWTCLFRSIQRTLQQGKPTMVVRS